MKIEEIIKKIFEILENSYFNPDESFKLFTYRGNNVPDKYKNVMQIISGKQNINKYNELLKSLHIEISKEYRFKISLETFTIECENLIICEKFTKNEIIKSLKNLKEYTLIEIRAIYGLKINSNVKKFGEYYFVNKNYIKRFLKNKCSVNDFDENFTKSSLERIDKEIASGEEFVYLVFEFKTIENHYNDKMNVEKVNEILNLLRYIYHNNLFEIYINLKPEQNFSPITYFTYNSILNKSFNFFLKKQAIILDDPILLKKSKKIWNLYLKTSKNTFENNLLKAINWLGISYYEENENLKIAEIAFAFETILTKNEKQFIDKGVTANLAESYSFVNGDNLKDRIRLEKEFKDFYTVRCSIVHGNNNKVQFDTKLYTNMIESTINALFTKRKFKPCFNNAELSQIIKNMRYK